MAGGARHQPRRAPLARRPPPAGNGPDGRAGPARRRLPLSTAGPVAGRRAQRPGRRRTPQRAGPAHPRRRRGHARRHRAAAGHAGRAVNLRSRPLPRGSAGPDPWPGKHWPVSLRGDRPAAGNPVRGDRPRPGPGGLAVRPRPPRRIRHAGRPALFRQLPSGHRQPAGPAAGAAGHVDPGGPGRARPADRTGGRARAGCCARKAASPWRWSGCRC